MLSDNSQHVISLDLVGNVHELYWSGWRWKDNNLTALASMRCGAEFCYSEPAAQAALTSPLHGYEKASDHSQHINFIDSSGDVHELFANGNGWVDNNLTALSLAHENRFGNLLQPIPVALPNALHGYWMHSDDSLHVNFIDSTGHVHELYSDGAGWTDNDLTLATQRSILPGCPACSVFPAGPGSSLAGYWRQSDDTQHVFFTDIWGNLHELYSDDRLHWKDTNLTWRSRVSWGGARASWGSALDAYSVLSDNTQHINFLDDGYHVHDMLWDGTAWSDFDISYHLWLNNYHGYYTAHLNYGIAGYVQEKDGTAHVNFIGRTSDVSKYNVEEVYVPPPPDQLDWDFNPIVFDVVVASGWGPLVHPLTAASPRPRWAGTLT
jgi:hypothetical protein